MDMWRQLRQCGLFFAVVLVACGGRDSDKHGSNRTPTEDARRSIEPLPRLEPVAMGKAALTDYAYSRGPARELFKRAVAADRREDFAAVVEHCHATLARDPGHLEAQWYLAVALARQQRYSEVAAPLSAAVAGDWLRWGERSLRNNALAGFRDTPHGRQYRDLARQYRQKFRTIASAGLLVVGRRGKPWHPKGHGDVLVNHRSEIYAYDAETRRYLRVSRTNGSLVGFIRKPEAMEIAYVSYRKAWTPPARKRSETSTGKQPYIRELRIGTVDLDVGSMSRHEVVFEKIVELELGYHTAEQGSRPTLIARVRTPDSPDFATHVVNIKTGRAQPAATKDLAASGERLRVAYRFTDLRRIPIAHVTADWDDDGAAGAFRLMQTRKTITLAAGKLANGHTMTWSPERTRLAFTTMADDPCSQRKAGRKVTLHVIDAATGKLRTINKGPGPLAPVWLDEQRIAYTDRTRRSPSVVIADVLDTRARTQLKTRAGMSTHHMTEHWLCPAYLSSSDDAFDD